jgi:hypothetical protein
VALLEAKSDNRNYRTLAAVAFVDQVRLAIVVVNCLAGLRNVQAYCRVLGYIDCELSRSIEQLRICLITTDRVTWSRRKT